MKTINLLVILILLSLQANATGYSHNMFVAHKKLQTGKEFRSVKERISKQSPAKTIIHKTTVTQASGMSAISYTQDLATKMSHMVTLNERMLKETPGSFFERKESSEINNSIANKLAGLIRKVIYTFIGSPSLAKP